MTTTTDQKAILTAIGRGCTAASLRNRLNEGKRWWQRWTMGGIYFEIERLEYLYLVSTRPISDISCVHIWVTRTARGDCEIGLARGLV